MYVKEEPEYSKLVLNILYRTMWRHQFLCLKLRH